jgi:hypothetical protein
MSSLSAEIKPDGFLRLYIGRFVKQQNAAAAMAGQAHFEIFQIGLGYRPAVGDNSSGVVGSRFGGTGRTVASAI